MRARSKKKQERDALLIAFAPTAKAAVLDLVARRLPLLLDVTDNWRLVTIGHRLFRQLGTRLVYDPVAGREFIARARAGDAVADQALRTHASRFLTEMGALPEDLDKYMAQVLIGQRPKLKSGGRGNVELRECVVDAVETITALGLGYKPTRNDSTEPPSACSLIAEIFAELGYPRFTEEVVKKAWNKRARNCGPG